MKAFKVVATLFAVGCMGVAGWQLHAWYQDNQESAGPARRTPAPGKTVAATPAVPLGKLPPLVQPKSFVVRTLPQPSRPSRMTDADWANAYPAFPHEPMDKSGFCAVPLPWRFAATPDAGTAGAKAGPAAASPDPAVAHALAFLLSYDLDWSPESYASAHAYWVFRRASELLAGPASAAYEPAKIAALVRGLGGTHAVGGALVRGKDGYVAALQVFDRDGKMVHQADFDKPMPFFDVLGDVSASAIGFLGGKPVPPARTSHLHRPRCARPESLAALGAVAFATDGSAEELAAYDAILKADPDFAEVRIWRADVQGWAPDANEDEDAAAAAPATGNAKRPGAARADELVAVLNKVPHPAALARLRPEQCSVPPSAEQLVGWADAADGLAGKDHPAVQAWRLRRSADLRVTPWDVALGRSALRPFVAAAGRHPNHRGLRDALLEAMPDLEYQTTLTPYDPELVAALSLAAATARGPSDDDRGDHWHRVAGAARALGRPAHVLEAVERVRREAAGASAAFGPGRSSRFGHLVDAELWAAEAHLQSGRFDQAATAFSNLARAPTSSGIRERAIDLAAVCSILSGRPDSVDQLAADPRTTAERSDQFLAGCRKYLAGEPVSVGDFPSKFNWRAEELLLAEAELAQGGDFARSDRVGVWRQIKDGERVFRHRLDWLVLEEYYRRQPTLPHRAGFYEAGEWMFPDDPAVTAAVAAWRQAGGGPDLPTVEQVVAGMAKRSWTGDERMPVWVAVARVRKELEANRPDEARRTLDAFGEGYPNARELVSTLTRRVDQAAGLTVANP